MVHFAPLAQRAAELKLRSPLELDGVCAEDQRGVFHETSVHVEKPPVQAEVQADIDYGLSLS